MSRLAARDRGPSARALEVYLEDIEFLLEHREGRAAIAKRLGITPDYVTTVVRRSGRTDLVERLRAAA